MAEMDQVELAARLQWALLNEFGRLMKDGTMTPTDRATLARLLRENGWKLDPNELPASLREKLTQIVDPLDFTEEEEL